MGYSVTAIVRFKNLFSGNESGYGTTVIKGMNDKGKVEAKCLTVKEPLQPTVLQKHLDGVQSIGISPIKEDGTCRFAAIDIDDYKFDLLNIVRAVYDFNLPLFPCWSKSKHLHLYMFFAEDVPASDVQVLAKRYLSLFCLPSNTEIFPKQNMITERTGFPSWINLPYFHAADKENCRKLVYADGQLCYSLDDALDYANTILLTLQQHNTFLDNLGFADAPPCITAGCLLRDIPNGCRNTWLFSLGVYLLLSGKGDCLEEQLQKVNNSLKDPVSSEEITNTIVKGLTKKTYFYKCKELSWRCSESICNAKKLGANTELAPGLEYGQLTEVHTDPVYWKWVVNGYEMVFPTTDAFLSQKPFQRMCVEKFKIRPRIVSEAIWGEITQKALNTCVDEYVEDVEDDFTDGAMFRNILSNYFWKRLPADSMMQVQMGRVFHKDGMMFYQPQSLLNYILETQGFKSFTRTEIRERLIKLGSIPKGTVWMIAEDRVKKPADITVDFTQKEEDESVPF